MKSRFILFRGDYCEDTETKKQVSLRTRNASEARTLLRAKNESFRQPVLNRQIARTYLGATDPEIAKRTWQTPMDEMIKLKQRSTLEPVAARCRTKHSARAHSFPPASRITAGAALVFVIDQEAQQNIAADREIVSGSERTAV
jgi:hypothetical protein